MKKNKRNLLVIQNLFKIIYIFEENSFNDLFSNKFKELRVNHLYQNQFDIHENLYY